MDEILVERAAGVVTVTLNRPERLNAVTGPMWGRMAEIFSEVGRSDDDRVMVVTGSGGAFCSGADLVAAASEGERRRHELVNMREVGDAAVALHRIPKPTIARVDGIAAGAGMNLALGCDLVVASDRARFSEIFVRRGLSVDFGGSWLLPRLVGLQKAKELLLFGDMLSAAEAAEMGLVNRVVPAAELDGFVAGWAAKLAAGPPLALSMSKRLLEAGVDLSFDQVVEAEAQAQSVNLASDDVRAALTAFLAKEEPVFRGR